MSKGFSKRNGWRKVRLGDLVDEGFCIIKNSLRQPLSSKKRSMMQGNYPYYGAAGQIDSINDYKLEGCHLLIAEDGTVTRDGKKPTLQLVDGKFWVSNHAHVLQAKNSQGTLMLYYMLSNINISIYITGAVQPKLSKSNLLKVKLTLPPLPEQKTIAEVLSSLDDKIDLLHRQNKTLETMVQTLFLKWFAEDADEGWKVGKLGDVVEIFDNKRIPLSKMQRDKKKEGKLYPYYGAAKIMDYVNDYIFDGEYVLMAEDGTVKTEHGYPVLQYANGKFWVNNHTHVFKAKKPYENIFIWHFLLRLNIERRITGAVQPKINQVNLMSIQFPKYPARLILEFQETAKPMFDKILKNKISIFTLENLRNSLLPKFMSKEIKIPYV